MLRNRSGKYRQALIGRDVEMEVAMEQPAPGMFRRPFDHHGISWLEVLCHHRLPVAFRVGSILLERSETKDLVKRAVQVHRMLGEAWINDAPADVVACRVFQRFRVRIGFAIDGDHFDAGVYDVGCGELVLMTNMRSAATGPAGSTMKAPFKCVSSRKGCTIVTAPDLIGSVVRAQ